MTIFHGIAIPEKAYARLLFADRKLDFGQAKRKMVIRLVPDFLTVTKSTGSRFFSNIRIPTVMALVGLFLLLIGYAAGNEVLISPGWILMIIGAGWFLILMRLRIYRLPFA